MDKNCQALHIVFFEYLSQWELIRYVNKLSLQELESQAATYKSKEIQKLLAEVKAELLKLEDPDTDTVKTRSSTPAPE